jgi:arginine decarboxylase
MPLVAFDRALIAAGISDINLIKLSSIVGPDLVKVDPFIIAPGALVGVAYARLESTIPGQRIASAVAVAHPQEIGRASIVMEHSAAATREEVEELVIEMARQALDSRGLTVARIESVAVEHVVQVAGSTIAAVVEV